MLANVPAGIAFLRASLARLRGDDTLAADYNRQALAQLDEDDWLMRSFVRWNQAAAEGLPAASRPPFRNLALAARAIFRQVWMKAIRGPDVCESAT